MLNAARREWSHARLARFINWVPLALVTSVTCSPPFAYLVSPLDLLPEFLLGPIGLVDDLIVVGAALSRLMNRLHPDLLRYHWSGRGDALDAIRRITRWAGGRIGDLLFGSVRRLLRRGRA